MASKRPEEVVQYVLKNMGEHATVAERVVNDLRIAGMLAHTHSVSLDFHIAEVGRLTRERDEAQKMRDYHEGRQRIAEESSATLGIELAAMRKERDEARANAAYAVGDWDKLQREVERLRATQSSPEVLAVVEAAKEWRDESDIVACPYRAGQALIAAVDALAAVERKAEPKPRYEFVASSGGWQEGGCVRDIRTQELVFGSWRGICDDDSLAAFHKARCEAECARLNAADAAGRKS